ncbi:MAG: hypothetical protein GY705_19305 [Bacteroidetes bacterium]|nr:hypothetical protein [Bacteroidota bacterium]
MTVQDRSSTQETFGNFDLTKALEVLHLFPYEKWNIPFHPVQPSESLTINLRRAERQIITGSNEWEQRLFMELIFLEALENHNIRMWQEKQLNAGISPFKGKVDFAFTPYQARFTTPYIIVSEAKKDEFEQGWGQCLMALKAAYMLNEQNGYHFEMYGIVSSGRIWEFGKYTQDNQFYRSDAYTTGQPELILGILGFIFAACEKLMV